MTTIKNINNNRRPQSPFRIVVIVGLVFISILFLVVLQSDNESYVEYLPAALSDGLSTSLSLSWQQQQQTIPGCDQNRDDAVIPQPQQNSTTATVMAMATGYELVDYQRYVGSLRKTGYNGHIILAVSPDLSSDIEEYLLSRGVTIKRVQYTPCSKPIITKQDESQNVHDKEMITCLYPYSHLKHRWSRFPLLRDYLQECKECTGPVLISDMRDTLFQRNPFGPDAPIVNSLQVFEEHYTIRTTHWLVDGPVMDCKGVQYNEPMLCSGTTIGTRSTMIEYLNIMQQEMELWMKDTKCCCFKMNGDDQSIHNYLYYSGQLNNLPAVAIPNRMGLVNTVGAQGSLILEGHIKSKGPLLELQGKNKHDAHMTPFDIAPDDNPKQQWLGLQYGMTDKDGYFVNYNGERSHIIHQIDRFGLNYLRWIEQNKNKLYM